MQDVKTPAILQRQTVKKVKQPRKNETLSASDAQALSVAVRSFLTEGYQFKRELIDGVKFYWEHSDPEKNPNSEDFKHMNTLKDVYRTVQEKISRMEKIQRQLKKIAKNQ